MPKTSFLSVTLLTALLLMAFLEGSLRADSLRFLTDLEYTTSTNSSKDKATGEKTDTDYSLFSQLYSLDFSKDLTPTLAFNGGGMFDLDNTDTETNGLKMESKDRGIRPYAELQLSTPILQAGTGYRRTEFKETETFAETTRRYSDEYTTRLDWKPVELPRVILNYSRILAHDEPLTTESTTDNLELQSKYLYKDFTFDYIHTNLDTLQEVSDFETNSTTDNGTIRYSHLYHDGKVAVSAGTRYKQDKVEFSGEGARLVDTSVPGTTFFNLDDPPPATSNMVADFTFGTLDNVNLLGTPTQLSFGLDFGSDTEVDTVYVLVKPENPTDPADKQASPSEVADIAHLFVWSVYESDDLEVWRRLDVRQTSFNIFENRFELSFAGANARYLKIVTTPWSQTLLPGKEIRLSNLEPKRTLPADTSEFSTTNWNTDLAVNWRMTDRTSTGYDMHYREEETKPFDDRRTWLNSGANIRHIFNKIFSGNMRVARSELTEKEGFDSISHTYSASLAGYYLETFNQTLTYSYGHNDDEEEGKSSVNSVLLRNNLDLYDGWSMNLDNGYSWQYPPEGGEATNTFARVGTTITPNRWMNATVDYEISWATQTDEPDIREQTSGILLSWVPYPTLSLSADLTFTDEEGIINDSYTRQMYGLNWAPFQDGTMQFSLSCGDSQDTDGEKTTSLSPALKWKVNRNSLLTFEYSVGESEDVQEENEFKIFIVTLRVYY
ncbi:MAG: hypothetical protein HY789_15305 [Deltaproteobacteria bacterium]|nr:hypothetical protein [Deltaproteobacteria bacterium]